MQQDIVMLAQAWLLWYRDWQDWVWIEFWLIKAFKASLCYMHNTVRNLKYSWLEWWLEHQWSGLADVPINMMDWLSNRRSKVLTWKRNTVEDDDDFLHTILTWADWSRNSVICLGRAEEAILLNYLPTCIWNAVIQTNLINLNQILMRSALISLLLVVLCFALAAEAKQFAAHHAASISASHL